MRILHVIPSLSASSGGPPRVVAHLAVAQTREGARITIGTSDKTCSTTALHDLGVSADAVDQIDLISIRAQPTTLVLGRTWPNRTLDAMVRRSDVVHVHGIWEPMLHQALRTAKHFGRVTVITPHGMISHYGMKKKPFKKAIALSSYVRRHLRSASLVHALTGTEAHEILHYAPNVNVRVVPNGVAADEFGGIHSRDTCAAIVPELESHPYVLFMARLDLMKGVDLLVRAFDHVRQSVPELRLILAGPDYGAETYCRELTRELGIERHVHFVGHIVGERKLALLAHAVCLVQPSRHEGFSLSLLEALASGTPVVVSTQVDLPGLAECRVGLFAEQNPRAVADAILHYARGNEPRALLTARSKELVRERYSWTKISRQLIAECAAQLILRDSSTYSLSST